MLSLRDEYLGGVEKQPVRTGPLRLCLSELVGTEVTPEWEGVFSGKMTKYELKQGENEQQRQQQDPPQHCGLVARFGLLKCDQLRLDEAVNLWSDGLWVHRRGGIFALFHHYEIAQQRAEGWIIFIKLRAIFDLTSVLTFHCFAVILCSRSCFLCTFSTMYIRSES